MHWALKWCKFKFEFNLPDGSIRHTKRASSGGEMKRKKQKTTAFKLTIQQFIFFFFISFSSSSVGASGIQSEAKTDFSTLNTGFPSFLYQKIYKTCLS
jgi:hypothetical protein